MSRVLPILFNTDMVRAILDGRKTVTRRIIRLPERMTGRPVGKCGDNDNPLGFMYPCGIKRPMCDFGDILYVRETWQYIDFAGDNNGYVYKASENGRLWESETDGWKWRPSIHMPKEAARIWLRVTDVRVERLQEITEEQACKEGTDCWDEACYIDNGWHPTFEDPDSGGDCDIVSGFRKLWDSTIKKSDLDRYGWAANPWVWVIEFERCEKPTEQK